MQDIYYAYSRIDGSFQGSGTPYFDTAELGCTLTPVPEYDPEVHIPHYIDDQWVLQPIPVIVAPEPDPEVEPEES